jgi:UDP-N-acetylmuramoyl-L-alanyl-D-glutamate--2,6-diaminopimelate ligase
VNGTVTDADERALDAVRALQASGLVDGPAVHDSRQVSSGCLYACLRGSHVDGHDFAVPAIEAGAGAVLVDHLVDGIDPTRQVVVDDTRRRLGPVAAHLAGGPSTQLTMVGITGTNGKTTTAELMSAILRGSGRPTGVIGTLHGPRTTPEAPELQATLRRFRDEGSTAAVLEVSSHALALHRVRGTRFDAVVFTNLGHDHLDLHGSPEEYFRAKASLFDAAYAPVGVVNVDDIHGRLIADAASIRIAPYTIDDAEGLTVSATEHRYTWRGHDVVVPLGGRFNVWNSLAAMTTAAELGIDADVAAAALATIGQVPGRFEIVDSPIARERGITVVVDYAHTPDGLAVLLDAARTAADGGAVIVVFGCGGDRDRDKRPEMGAIAARGADVVIVTSDNPRHERPETIIDDVVAGIDVGSRDRVETDPDRAAAICRAIATARAGDVVVIAGKGHERTQEFADAIVEFDDRVAATRCLEGAA